MLEIEHNGFVAFISIDGNRLRGRIRDTHEPLSVDGETVAEIRENLKTKIEEYCSRCKRRGIPPFDTPDGRSSAELDAELHTPAQQLGENESLQIAVATIPASWPHKHSAFFWAKAWLVREHELRPGKPISKKLRLPIDGVIETLNQRERSPTLADLWRGKERSPYSWARYRLAEAFERVAAADPRMRGRAREFNLEFLEAAKRLSAEATDFLSRYGSSEGSGVLSGFPKFSRGIPPEQTQTHYETCIWAEQGLQIFLERLHQIMSWVYADMDILNPSEGGRPRLSWKHDFVAAIAELWVELTLKRPSSKPEGLFAELVDAAWRSGGADMPLVDWTEAVRMFGRGLRKGRETLPVGE
jgi:predicted HicB family RNase H-like nuclease